MKQRNKGQCFVCDSFGMHDKLRTYEDNKVSAFLSYNPVTRGHSCVFWKDHVLFSSLSKRDTQYLVDVTTRISRVLKKVFGSDSINRLNYNFDNETPHAYFELIPIYHNEVERTGFYYFIPNRKKNRKL